MSLMSLQDHRSTSKHLRYSNFPSTEYLCQYELFEVRFIKRRANFDFDPCTNSNDILPITFCNLVSEMDQIMHSFKEFV